MFPPHRSIFNAPSASPWGQHTSVFGPSRTPSPFAQKTPLIGVGPFPSTTASSCAQQTPLIGVGPFPSTTASSWGQQTPMSGAGSFPPTTASPWGQQTPMSGAGSFPPTTASPWGQQTPMSGAGSFPLTTASPWGQQTRMSGAGSFPSTTASPFGPCGQQTFGGFGQTPSCSNSNEGTRAIPYPTTTEDDNEGRYNSISAMKEYRNKSHEELRFKDYKHHLNGGPPHTTPFPIPSRPLPMPNLSSSNASGSFCNNNCPPNRSSEHLNNNTSPFQSFVSSAPLNRSSDPFNKSTGPSTVSRGNETSTVNLNNGQSQSVGASAEVNYVQAFVNCVVPAFVPSGPNGGSSGLQSVNPGSATAFLGFPVFFPTTAAFAPQHPQNSGAAVAQPVFGVPSTNTAGHIGASIPDRPYPPSASNFPPTTSGSFMPQPAPPSPSVLGDSSAFGRHPFRKFRRFRRSASPGASAPYPGCPIPRPPSQNTTGNAPTTTPGFTPVPPTAPPFPTTTTGTSTNLSPFPPNTMPGGLVDPFNSTPAFSHNVCSVGASTSTPITSTPPSLFPPSVGASTTCGPLHPFSVASSSTLNNLFSPSTGASTSGSSVFASAPSFGFSKSQQSAADVYVPKGLELIVEKLGLNPWAEETPAKSSDQVKKILPCSDASTDANIIELAEFAVDQHNAMAKGGDKVTFAKVIAACLEAVDGGRYHIVLQAREAVFTFDPREKMFYASVLRKKTDRPSHLTVLERWVPGA